MRLWPDYIASRRRALTVLLFCTLFLVILTGVYAQRPPAPRKTPSYIAPGEQAIVLQEEEGMRILLLYDPISQGFRCAVSLTSDPKQVLYSPSVNFDITPGHPLTIRYPNPAQEDALETDGLAVGIDCLLPIEVCITPRTLTTSQSSRYTSETFLSQWHVRWKELGEGAVWA